MYKLTKSNSILRKSDNACIPMDEGNSDYQAYLQWVAQGNEPEPVDLPSVTELVTANTSAIQAEMDRQAQLKGYDNLLSACTYAMQPEGAPFQAEGMAFIIWRTQVWSQAYAVLAQVQAGEIPLPTPEESVAQMPELILPA